MEQAELSQLSNTIRSSMGETAGKFRDAAERGNNNLAKILGTVAAALKAQRQDLAEIQNVLSETESVTERNASSLQSIQAELQDINSGIHDIATGMKNMARGIANVDNSIFRLNQDLQSSIGQSLLPGLLTGLSGTATSIVKGITALAMGGLAIGGAKTAMDYMTGGGAAGEGGGFGGIGGVKQVSNPVVAKDIYSYLKQKGVDHEHAVGILANIQNESKFNSGALGDYQGGVATSGGLFQHHNERFTAMKQAAGPEWQKNWKGQVDYALSEGDMQSYLKRPVRSGEEAARAFVYDFERPKDKSGEAAKRAGNVAAVEKLVSGATVTETKPSGNVSVTPQSSPMQSQYEQPPVSSEGVSRVEKIGGEHGHGPISGAAEHGGGHGEQGKLSGVQPGILQKFHQIESQAGTQLNVTSGFRDPAHNAAVGGAKDSAHTRGNAVDVTFNGGVEQTNKLIEVASNAGIGGIGVYRPGVLHFDTEAKRAWGPDYHSSSIPDWAKGAINKHLGGSTGSSGGGGETTPQTSSGSLSAMTPAMPAVSAGITPDQMAMITGGMNPLAMAATSAMMSQLQSAQEEAAAIAPQQQQEPQTPQFDQTQILSQLSKSSENAQIVQQAAVAKQAQQEMAQQEPITDLLSSIFGQLGGGGSSTVVNNSSNMSAGGYNGQYDIGWPDWAEMIGGNHWKEMKSYKKNMWG